MGCCCCFRLDTLLLLLLLHFSCSFFFSRKQVADDDVSSKRSCVFFAHLRFACSFEWNHSITFIWISRWFQSITFRNSRIFIFSLFNFIVFYVNIYEFIWCVNMEWIKHIGLKCVCVCVWKEANGVVDSAAMTNAHHCGITAKSQVAQRKTV